MIAVSRPCIVDDVANFIADDSMPQVLLLYNDSVITSLSMKRALSIVLDLRTLLGHRSQSGVTHFKQHLFSAEVNLSTNADNVSTDSRDIRIFDTYIEESKWPQRW